MLGMKGSRKKDTKFVTMPVFEKGMDFMAKSFAKVFDRFDKVDERFDKVDERFDKIDKVIESILKELQGQRQEAREHRMMMSDLNRTDVIQHRKIEGLMRVEKLEEKVK
jgi:DNA anti-recombination protein RmuC